MIQTRHWKRHLKVGLWVAVGVAAVLTGIILVDPNDPVVDSIAYFLAWPAQVFDELLRPVWQVLNLLPESVRFCNAVLFCAAVWGALAAFISHMLSFLFSRETKPTPPR